jgi:lysyl-tRNA synthetase class 2
MADQPKASEVNINDEREVRRAKRQSLIDAGVNPYPVKSKVTAHAAEIDERYAGLADIVEANNGLCCPAAERYLLENWAEE